MEKAHSNIEIREYYITEDIRWISQKKEWAEIKSIGCERKTIEKRDNTKIQEERYYITSLEGDVEQFSKAVRTHWQVENNLHWHLDYTFKEDNNLTMNKNAQSNLNILRKLWC